MGTDSPLLTIPLREERTGFGTRLAGRELRTKCLELLDAVPGRVLVLDWREVPLVSSGFADEFLGKLFVTLSPSGFGARVRNTGMEPLVRGLVNKAILQRMAQTAAADGAEPEPAESS